MSQVNLKKVDLLPFHNIAAPKYERLGKRSELVNLNQIDVNRTNEIRKKFESAQITTNIGD